MTIPTRPFAPRLRSLPCLVLLGTLAACSGSDDNGPIGSGGGAGDDVQNERIAADVATLTPFEGVYDLTGNWRGIDGDAGFLIIRSPSSGTGTSEVILSDVDETVNCRERPRDGTLLVDDAGGNEDVFLNGLIDFDRAVATLTGRGELQLMFTDTNDIDGDGLRDDRVGLVVPRVAITEQDLPPSCR